MKVYEKQNAANGSKIDRFLFEYHTLPNLLPILVLIGDARKITDDQKEF